MGSQEETEAGAELCQWSGPDRRRKLPDSSAAGYTEVTWAEDRATRGRDPSANPGAKTGMGGRTPPLGIPGIGL